MSCRYSHEELKALDIIGGAYTDKRISFDVACELRDEMLCGNFKNEWYLRAAIEERAAKWIKERAA